MQVLQVDVFLPLLHSFLHPAAPPLQNLHCAHGPLQCNTIIAAISTVLFHLQL